MHMRVCVCSDVKSTTCDKCTNQNATSIRLQSVYLYMGETEQLNRSFGGSRPIIKSHENLKNAA